VKVVFDVFRHRDFEAHRLEDGEHLFEDVGYRMDMPRAIRIPGNGHVEALFIERFVSDAALSFSVSASICAVFDFALDLID